MSSGQKWIFVFIAGLFLSTTALATKPMVPRGSEVLANAGHCSIGPFGTDGDVGVYRGMCHRLTNIEKCFAYLKLHIRDDGRMDRAYDSAKARFCEEALMSKFN